MPANLQELSDLVNTSVEDMQSGLWAYTAKDLYVLRRGLATVKRRKEKTKAIILTRKIKTLERELKAGA
jgi:hypothetical protein